MKSIPFKDNIRSSEQIKNLVIDFTNLKISNSDFIYTLYELGYINVKLKLIKGELFLTCKYNHPILENIYFFLNKKISEKILSIGNF